MAAGLVTLTILDGLGATKTAQFWSSDGTTAGLLYAPAVIIDSLGAALDWTAASPVSGFTASGSAIAKAPVTTGGRAATANPTAVADGQVVNALYDKVGRNVTSPFQVRDLMGDAFITITSSTAAAQLLTAGAAGVFNDIVSITLNNSSASDTVVQILDADGTTVRWTGTAKANDMRGIVLPTPLKGAAAAAAWKAKTITSVSSVVITIQYAINT